MIEQEVAADAWRRALIILAKWHPKAARALTGAKASVDNNGYQIELGAAAKWGRTIWDHYIVIRLSIREAFEDLGVDIAPLVKRDQSWPAIAVSILEDCPEAPTDAPPPPKQDEDRKYAEGAEVYDGTVMGGYAQTPHIFTETDLPPDPHPNGPESEPPPAPEPLPMIEKPLVASAGDVAASVEAEARAVGMNDEQILIAKAHVAATAQRDDIVATVTHAVNTNKLLRATPAMLEHEVRALSNYTRAGKGDPATSKKMANRIAFLALLLAHPELRK